MATTPIFVDTNIPFYAVGRSHELKEPCRQVLVLVDEHPGAFATNAEVLQEMLHRYRGGTDWPVRRAYVEDFAALMRGRIAALRGDDVVRAAHLADRYPSLNARDLAHVAVMQRLGLAAIVSADGHFDAVPEIRRLDPRTIATWRHEVG
jgi:predicted nucleic acid-binding protein